MPELDIKTLQWVLSKSQDLQNKIWDLRETIQETIETIKENEPKKISLQRSGSRRNGFQKNGFKVPLNQALSSRS